MLALTVKDDHNKTIRRWNVFSGEIKIGTIVDTGSSHLAMRFRWQDENGGWGCERTFDAALYGEDGLAKQAQLVIMTVALRKEYDDAFAALPAHEQERFLKLKEEEERAHLDVLRIRCGSIMNFKRLDEAEAKWKPLLAAIKTAEDEFFVKAKRPACAKAA